MSNFHESLNILFNTIGIIGMVAILLAYFMQQIGKWRSDAPPYLLTNIGGAGGLLISLLWSWNLASFLLECAWLTISMLGLIKYYRRKPDKDIP